MELVKNIFFNTDKLLQNSKVKISYTGKFFEDFSQEVFIHYGFGPDWEDLADEKMSRTDLGLQIEIDLLENDTFNFCFRNENNEWDNNDGNDYIFELERPSLDLIIQEINSLDRPNRLRKTYLWSKKIRLAIYKVITYIPKIISGNYKRKIKDDNF